MLSIAIAAVDSVVPAVAALTGVALTLFGSWMTERRRWRRERVNTAEEHRLEMRQATRLVEQELWEAEHLIAAAVTAGTYPLRRRVSTIAWSAWRPSLARHLGVADWQAVAKAYDALQDLNRLLDMREPASVAVVVEDEDALENRWDAVRTAAWLLRGEAGEGEKVQIWLEEHAKLAAQLFETQGAHMQR